MIFPEEVNLPLPPFTIETARQMAQIQENLWNSKSVNEILKNYASEIECEDRTVFLIGKDSIELFLINKWKVELDYKLKNTLWGFRENRMAIRIEYEWHTVTDQWYRSIGNELWEFNSVGLMTKRYACINDLPINAGEKKTI
jgi:uncharacterized protein